MDERSSLGTVSKRKCFYRNARARNTYVEATLNLSCPAQVPAALQTADDVALYRNRRDLENRLGAASYSHDDGFAGGGHDYIGDSYHLIDDEPGGDDTRRASRLRVMELCDTGG